MKFFSRVCLTLAVFLSSILPAKADITDGHFSTNQIFDVQYYWSGTTLNASNFIAPFDMNFQHPTVSSGQYFAFFNSTTNPGTYGLGLYNSDGTLAQVLHNTGTLQAIGPDALFYVGSGFFGTVITTSAGYAYGQSASFANMDTSVTSAEASSYTWASTTPLGAGQTAGGGGGAPTVVGTSTSNQVTTSTSNGASTTSSSTAYGTATSTDVVTYGTAVVTVAVADHRGAETAKTLQINHVTTTTTQTPVTTTTTTVTPWTTTTTVTTPVTTTTTTTPVTTTTYSDGSTTTSNGTPTVTSSTTNSVQTSQTSGTTTTVSANTVTNTQVSSSTQEYYTRIDQYAVLSRTNSLANLLSSDNLLNRHSVINGDLSFRGNVDTSRTVSFYAFGDKTADHSVDNYLIQSSRYGFGLDKLVRDNLVIGLSVSKFDSNMGGNDATGSLTKDIFALNSTWVARNWIVSSQLGYANNVFAATHSLPALGYSNSSRTSGTDHWLSARLYTPDLVGFRPFVGARHENNRRDAVAESGSAITAMNYAAVDSTVRTHEYGLRYDRQFGTMAVYGEVGRNSQDVTISRLGVGKHFNNRVSLIVGATHVHTMDIQSTTGSVVLRIGF